MPDRNNAGPAKNAAMSEARFAPHIARLLELGVIWTDEKWRSTPVERTHYAAVHDIELEHQRGRTQRHKSYKAAE